MSFLTYYLISCILILIIGIVYDKFFEEFQRGDPFALSVAICFGLIPCLNNFFAIVLLWDMVKKLPDLLYNKILDKVMQDIKEKAKEE